jgi:hypothetical protein
MYQIAGLTRARSITQIIRLSITIEISRTYQAPANGKGRTKLAPDKHVIVHVPNRSLARAGVVKHIIRLAVAVKIRGRNERPAAGQGRAKEAAAKRAPGEMPECATEKSERRSRVNAFEYFLFCVGTATTAPCRSHRCFEVFRSRMARYKRDPPTVLVTTRRDQVAGLGGGAEGAASRG